MTDRFLHRVNGGVSVAGIAPSCSRACLRPNRPTFRHSARSAAADRLQLRSTAAGCSASRATFRLRGNHQPHLPAELLSDFVLQPHPEDRLVRHHARARRSRRGSRVELHHGRRRLRPLQHHGHETGADWCCGADFLDRGAPRWAGPTAAALKLRSAATGPARSNISMSTSERAAPCSRRPWSADAVDPYPRQRLPRRRELPVQRHRLTSRPDGKLGRFLHRVSMPAASLGVIRVR